MMWWYKQRAVIDILFAMKESVRNFHKYLCNIYGSAAVNRSTIGLWVQKVTATKLHDLPWSGCPVVPVRPEVLVCDDAIIREDGRITTRQLVLSLSISKGSVSHIIRDLGFSKVCTRCVPQSFTVKRKTKRKAISSTLLVCFQAQGETYPSWIVTADETWFCHFELETKRQSAGMVLLSVSPEERIQTFFISGQGHDHCLLSLCRTFSFGSNAEMADRKLWCICQYAWRTWKVFQMSMASQDSNKTLLQHDSAKAAYKCEDLGSHYKICLGGITPSTLQPRPSTFRFPPMWNPEGCILQYEVWDWWQCDLHSENLTARQGMILTKHTHTCSSLAQHHGSGWRLWKNRVWSQTTPHNV